jgi:predicted metalloprotease
MKILKCEVCDVQVPGPLLRCPAHINFKFAYRPRRITLQKAWVLKIKDLDPEDRHGAVKVLAAQLNCQPGAIYHHLKRHFNFKKVGKYLVYGGDTQV